MKQQKYKIKWRSRITKAKGEGQPVFTKIEAAREVIRANNKFPELEHWSARA